MKKSLDILQFHPAHAEVADLTEYEKKNYERIGGAFQILMQLNQKSTQAVTIMDEGRIILMCGFITLWPGNVELWLIPTNHLQESPIQFCKLVKKFIENTAEVMKLHRMQAQAVDDTMHTKFMKLLGFEQEGIFKQYTDIKEDYIAWARLFPERKE